MFGKALVLIRILRLDLRASYSRMKRLWLPLHASTGMATKIVRARSANPLIEPRHHQPGDRLR